MNRRLIITADDYGMCDAVNDAIEECLAAGAVHATCVMINMPAYAAAAALRQRFPHRSIGIHWNLTQGRPLLPPSQIPSLVNGDDGNFLPASQLRCRWLLRRISPAELTAELRAQYQRFCEVAGEPDFWNTHENVHVLPGLFETCVALGQALRIPAMRCHRRLTMPRDTTRRRYNLHHPLYWVKGWIIARWSSQAEARGVMMPDARLYMPGYEVSLAAIAEAMKHHAPPLGSTSER